MTSWRPLGQTVVTELTLFLAARANPGSQQSGGPGSRCGSDQRAAMPQGSRRRASVSSWAIGPCRPGEVTRASSILDLAPVEYARRPTRDEVAQRLTRWTTSGDPPAASRGIARRRDVNVTPRIARGLGATAMAAVLLAGCSGAQPPSSSAGGVPTGTPGATLAPSLPPTLAPTIRPTATPTPEPTSAPEISVAWTRHHGTASDEAASAIAVDDGGITVVGTTSGTYEQPLPGGSDGLFQRYDLAGEVLWTREFGTPGQDWAKDVAADASGLTVLWTSRWLLREQGQREGSLPASLRPRGHGPVDHLLRDAQG